MAAPSPFDALAETYDSDFSLSAIGGMQRDRVWSFLTPLLEGTGSPLKILEINCGTGDDAMQMAAMGHTIIATDASEQMIWKAKEKMSGSVHPNSIEFVVCPFDQLATVFEGQQFNLIFSNFGGLNCISKDYLKKLGKDLATLIAPGGKLLVVLMGRCCIWEIFYYGIRGKFKTASRRMNATVNFRVNDSSMPVYYYSPAGLKRVFSPSFTLLEKYPVGLFIPPSYLEKKFTGKQNHLKKLERRENKFGYSFLSSFADHYCAIFKTGEVHS